VPDLNELLAQIAHLKHRRDQIGTDRRDTRARLEELNAKYSAAVVDDDTKAIAHLRASIREADSDIAAYDAAVPEIARRLEELHREADKLARADAAKATLETRSAYLAKLGEVDQRTTAVIQEQLAPLYRELRNARATAAEAERKELDLLGNSLPAEPAWARAARATYPTALWLLDTIDAIAKTGNPPGAPVAAPMAPAREGARRLGL
jgi:chromosome segregation ATPase